MNTEKFANWLVEEKGFSNKVSRDTLSRLRRVLNISGETEVSKKTISLAEKNEGFIAMSIFVKSQLRRAVNLALEFMAIK